MQVKRSWKSALDKDDHADCDFHRISGFRGNLAVVVRSHTSAVTCVDVPPGIVPRREACRNMMDRIPLSSNYPLLVFGNQGQPGVDVRLPLIFSDGECPLLVVVYTACPKGERRVSGSSLSVTFRYPRMFELYHQHWRHGS